MPDGTNPRELIERWYPWYQDCMDMVDGDGTFRHFPYPGSLKEQPEYDMQVYRAIRQKYVECRNAELKKSYARTAKRKR